MRLEVTVLEDVEEDVRLVLQHVILFCCARLFSEKSEFCGFLFRFWTSSQNEHDFNDSGEQKSTCQ